MNLRLNEGAVVTFSLLNNQLRYGKVLKVYHDEVLLALQIPVYRDGELEPLCTADHIVPPLHINRAFIVQWMYTPISAIIDDAMGPAMCDEKSIKKFKSKAQADENAMVSATSSNPGLYTPCRNSKLKSPTEMIPLDHRHLNYYDDGDKYCRGDGSYCGDIKAAAPHIHIHVNSDKTHE